MWRIAENIINELLRTADKRQLFCLGAGQMVDSYSSSKLNMLRNGTPYQRTRITIYVCRNSLSLLHVYCQQRFNRFHKTAYEAKNFNKKQQIFLKCIFVVQFRSHINHLYFIKINWVSLHFLLRRIYSFVASFMFDLYFYEELNK